MHKVQLKSLFNMLSRNYKDTSLLIFNPQILHFLVLVEKDESQAENPTFLERVDRSLSNLSPLRRVEEATLIPVSFFFTECTMRTSLLPYDVS